MPPHTPAPASAPPATRVQVALGGALGASVRVGAIVVALSAAGERAWAVLLVNLAGAVLLGFVVGRATHSDRVARWSPLLGTGLAGALTSFSALVVDVARFGADRPEVAVGYAAASLLGGTLLAWVGLHRGRR